jgi:acyl dehydratase
VSASFDFERAEVGDTLPALRVTLASEAVRAYALAANMPGGRFLSDEAAKREGLPGQIVPGNMSLALFSRLLGSSSEGVRIRRLSATYRSIVHPDVPLVLRAVVTEKHVGEAGDFVECDLLLENAEGDRLVTGTATIELVGRARP